MTELQPIKVWTSADAAASSFKAGEADCILFFARMVEAFCAEQEALSVAWLQSGMVEP